MDDRAVLNYGNLNLMRGKSHGGKSDGVEDPLEHLLGDGFVLKIPHRPPAGEEVKKITFPEAPDREVEEIFRVGHSSGGDGLGWADRHAVAAPNAEGESIGAKPGLLFGSPLDDLVRTYLDAEAAFLAGFRIYIIGHSRPP